ncbi:ribulose-phosphate 3-epimerase [Bacteriovorax sp. BSW11_IV]|uniref:ribulose-phosphate 3-epimerase n=1 Tax=Bacteriovorax sp. BSW11_IV TaxID=1353529 RepID=UPI00038A375F|nr:ribulose-phosphate 3-epimerase [Bacteriovorax sp. BSW11_IV]EQC50030.1 ribulose-phosphate 3-epimerase [Bacteriovorax sp. BSW11_IV]
MTIISPSILACDFVNIEKEISVIENVKDVWVHLDIMDGHFVPNLTFGIPVIKRISEITKLPLDAHLMVTNPEFHIDQMKDFGIHNITFHIEAVSNPIDLIREAKKHYKSVGISIKPNTSVDVLTDDILSELDLVLIMSVEPGFGGQSFQESSLDKIEKLSSLKKKFNFTIQVDGGIKGSNAHMLTDAGADNLVAGSYVFNNKPETYILNIESLRK